MSYSTVADLDAADDRELRREAARAQVRGQHIPPTPDPTPAPRDDAAEIKSYAPPPSPRPSPATMPPTATPAPFRLIGATLPIARQGRGYEAPAVRLQAIALAIEHPGQWVEYRSNPGDPFKNPSTIVTQARKGRGGFREGFTAKTVRGIAYIRFDEDSTETTE